MTEPDRQTHLNDLSRSVVLFTPDLAFDLDQAQGYFPIPLMPGERPPVYELESQVCPNGCCARTIVHDTANDTHRVIFDGKPEDAPPPEFERIALRRFQGALN